MIKYYLAQVVSKDEFAAQVGSYFGSGIVLGHHIGMESDLLLITVHKIEDEGDDSKNKVKDTGD